MTEGTRNRGCGDGDSARVGLLLEQVREGLRRIAALMEAGEIPPENWRRAQQAVVAILVGESGRLAGLSDREQEVWRLRCEGLPSRDIGERLVLSENTVNTHVQKVHEKLDAHGKCEVTIRHRRARDEGGYGERGGRGGDAEDAERIHRGVERTGG